MIKSAFSDWYDYLMDPSSDIKYNRLTRTIELREGTTEAYVNKVAKKLLKYSEASAVWIGVYPFMYLCPTNLWANNKIELDWWKLFHPKSDWETQFESFLKENRPEDYKAFIKNKDAKYGRNKVSQSSWLVDMTSNDWDSAANFNDRNKGYISIIEYLKSYAAPLIWDHQALTFKKYDTDIFFEVNAPILVANFNMKVAEANPCLNGFKIPTTRRAPVIPYTYYIPNELKGGLMDIGDRISEFVTSSVAPTERTRTDAEKITSHGFDLKTSFRKCK